jgi:hypothetical protein
LLSACKPPCPLALALALVIGLQILNGATKFLVYNLYAAGLYALFELASDARAKGIEAATKLGGVVLGAVALGFGLAAGQLLPSLALASESSRSGGGASLAAALHLGTVPPSEFLGGVLGSSGMLGIGILFRRPNKFLHLWGFAGALFSALASARLSRSRDEGASALQLRGQWSFVSIVGAGSTVIRDVAPMTTVVGTPARPI